MFSNALLSNLCILITLWIISHCLSPVKPRTVYFIIFLYICKMKHRSLRCLHCKIGSVKMEQFSCVDDLYEITFIFSIFSPTS